MVINIEAKKYLAWYKQFEFGMWYLRPKLGPKIDKVLSEKDYIYLRAAVLLNELRAFNHSDKYENLRVAVILLNTITEIIVGDNLYHKYGGENALSENKDALIYTMTLLANREVITPSEDLWDSKLRVPSFEKNHPVPCQIKTVDDTYQYLAAICRYFRKDLSTNEFDPINNVEFKTIPA